MSDESDGDVSGNRGQTGDGARTEPAPSDPESGSQEHDDEQTADTEPRSREHDDEHEDDRGAAGWTVLFPAGAIVGVVAFALVYLLTYTFASGPIRNSAIGAVAGEDVWRLVGWVFFNAHFVDTVGAVSTLGIEITGAVNVVGQLDAFPAVLYAVPPAVLLLAGGLMAYRMARGGALPAAARAGVSVMPGYLVPVVVGAFLFRTTSGPGAVGPEPVTATFLAGIVYPLVFGIAGAIVGSRL